MAINRIELFSIDTLLISESKPNYNLLKYIYFYEDSESKVKINDLIELPEKYQFTSNNSSKLNFGFSTSTYWLKFDIKNTTSKSKEYVISVSNPDINYIDFYELNNNNIIKKVITGEFCDIKTRDIYHHNFVFNILLKPESNHTFLISVNNGGGPLFIPIELIERSIFFKKNNKAELLYWLIYGFLIFIFLFNLYLCWSTKEKVSLNYAFSVLFAVLFFIYYDGYFSYLNPPVVVSKFKFFFPSLYTVFLVSFTQNFVSENSNFKSFKKYLNPYKIIAIVAAISYIFPFPVSMIAEIGVPILIMSTFLLIIVIAVATLDKNYNPSILFLIAFITVFSGMTIHELKEFDILPPVFFVNNATKFGLAVQCIILTIAVLERFRINQDKAKSIIHENYVRIEGQNKELEIINLELEKLSIVASETNNSVAIYDKKGRLEWCNAGFERFYSLTHEDLISTDSDNIDKIIGNKDIDKLFSACLNNRKPISFETKVFVKSKEKWVQTTLTPYPRNGSITKIIAIDSDITPLKKYEKELEAAKEKAVESDRLKTIFLGNMSHEIRTPLNGILGFTELLGRTSVPEDKKDRYYKLIMSNGEQLIRIIDDIVDISLIESDQLKFEESEFDVNHIINEVIDYVEMYKTDLGKTNLHIILQNDIPHNSTIIYTDPVRLKQVLMNILKNGFKFTAEGYVKLQCKIINKHIHFEVEDTGIGIEPEKATFIFDRFRQGDESLSRKYGGTGLGLSISKGIIDKMQGKIWIDTDYHSGLRICFEIPYIGKNTNEQFNQIYDYSTAENDPLNNKNFLVVEDDETSYELLTEILSPYKTNITHASNGIEAIEFAKEKEFDVILMDINLPILDGVSATKEIRKFNSNIFILAQTAYAMKIEKENILSSGCDDIICKPLNSDELIKKISSYFNNKA